MWTRVGSDRLYLKVWKERRPAVPMVTGTAGHASHLFALCFSVAMMRIVFTRNRSVHMPGGAFTRPSVCGCSGPSLHCPGQARQGAGRCFTCAGPSVACFLCSFSPDSLLLLRQSPASQLCPFLHAALGLPPPQQTVAAFLLAPLSRAFAVLRGSAAVGLSDRAKPREAKMLWGQGTAVRGHGVRWTLH